MSKVYKKIIALFLCLSMVFATACGGAGKDSSDSGKSSDKNDKKEKVKVTMVTDQGGINDKSFNQSAYEGFENAKKRRMVGLQIYRITQRSRICSKYGNSIG